MVRTLRSRYRRNRDRVYGHLNRPVRLLQSVKDRRVCVRHELYALLAVSKFRFVKKDGGKESVCADRIHLGAPVYTELERQEKKEESGFIWLEFNQIKLISI